MERTAGCPASWPLVLLSCAFGGPLGCRWVAAFFPFLSSFMGLSVLVWFCFWFYLRRGGIWRPDVVGAGLGRLVGIDGVILPPSGDGFGQSQLPGLKGWRQPQSWKQLAQWGRREMVVLWVCCPRAHLASGLLSFPSSVFSAETGPWIRSSGSRSETPGPARDV